jgi:hypothetical protein
MQARDAFRKDYLQSSDINSIALSCGKLSHHWRRTVWRAFPSWFPCPQLEGAALDRLASTAAEAASGYAPKR